MFWLKSYKLVKKYYKGRPTNHHDQPTKGGVLKPESRKISVITKKKSVENWPKNMVLGKNATFAKTILICIHDGGKAGSLLRLGFLNYSLTTQQTNKAILVERWMIVVNVILSHL